MKDKEKLVIIVGILLLLSLYPNLFSTVCTKVPAYTNYRTLPMDFACVYNQGCVYQITCDSGNPYPASNGKLDYNKQTSFYCMDINNNPMSDVYFTISIEGTTCVESKIKLTPYVSSEYTTDDEIKIDVKVDGGGEGYIVHGLIKEMGLKRDGFTSFAIASIDFGNLPRGQYTLEVWGDNTDKVTRTFTVYGVIDLKYSFTPIQPYNFVDGNIYLKDENGIGIGKYDLEGLNEGISIKVYPKDNPFKTYPFTLSYLGKDDVSGGKFYFSGSTDYVGDLIIEVTVNKNGYLVANEKIQVNTFIPSLIIEVRCLELDCPFPNSATLGETKDFTFWTRKGDEKVDATVTVKVTNPSRTLVDKNVDVVKIGTGTYRFSYGPFDEVEAWTFTIYAEYLGVDPQTIQPKVSVSKEEQPIVFNPWLIVIPLVIIGIVLWVRKR